MKTTFKKRPLEISALQWTGDNITDVLCFIADGTETKYIYENGELYVDAFNNMKLASKGDYIIKDKTYCYPCKPDIFLSTHNETPVFTVWTKKEYTVEAITLWDNPFTVNIESVSKFCGDNISFPLSGDASKDSMYADANFICILNTLEGPVKIFNTDAIVKGVAGEFYPVNKEKFIEIYY